MSEAGSSDLTRLLLQASDGDRDALDALMPVVYEELRRLARGQLRREYPGHTLDSVALVNEAYLRLVGGQGVSWQNRSHFFGIAARAMRTILVDHARARRAAKRGGGMIPVALDAVAELIGADGADQLVEIDEALTSLAEVDTEAARTFECRYFAGLTLDETAEALDLSVATVRRRWDFAKAWLRRALSTTG